MRTEEPLTTILPRFFVETINGVPVVRPVVPDLTDEGAIAELGDLLDELVDQWGVTGVLLNFQEVRHMSSAVLGVLLKFSRRVARHRGRLKLCRLALDLREIFRITKFEQLFEIHDEERLALESFRAPSRAAS